MKLPDPGIPAVKVFRDGEPMNGFVGAYPASLISDLLDERVLARAAEQPGGKREVRRAAESQDSHVAGAGARRR